ARDILVHHRSSTGQLAVGWPNNGIAIASLPVAKQLAAVAPDGAGGVLVGWSDLRGGSQWTSYVQRVDGGGTALWTSQGIALSNGSGDQLLEGMVPDGSGGAIALWMDGRSPTWDLYTQRIDAAGAAQWAAGG